MSNPIALRQNDLVMIYRKKPFVLIEGTVYEVVRQSGRYVRSATPTQNVPRTAINTANHQGEIFRAHHLPNFQQ